MLSVVSVVSGVEGARLTLAKQTLCAFGFTCSLIIILRMLLVFSIAT